jgi:cytochrome c oxidase subunit 2
MRSRSSRRPVWAAVGLSLATSVVLAACGGGDGEAAPVLSPAGERGKAVASAQGCTSCHTPDGSRSTGPSWLGLAGSEVQLDSGKTVTADDAYLSEAILNSRREVVQGYANIMPVYENEISEDELADLLAYLNDLSPPGKAPEGN